MKKSTLFLSTALVSLTLGSCAQVATSSEEVVTEGLKFNESTFPYDGGVLVANFGCDEFNSRNNEGKGYVTHLKDGEMSTLIPADGSLSAPKGMLIKDGYLLLCDVNRVVIYNLENLEEPSQTVMFPQDEIAVNDLALSGDTIYASVTNSGNIFTIDGSDMPSISSAEPQLWCNVEGANGLCISDSMLYVCSFPVNGPMGENNVIYKIESLENPIPTKLFSTQGKWDGIAISEDGSTLYASNWDIGGIVAYDLEAQTMTTLEFDYQFQSPADFSLVDGVFYIPDMLSSAVVVRFIFDKAL